MSISFEDFPHQQPSEGLPLPFLLNHQTECFEYFKTRTYVQYFNLEFENPKREPWHISRLGETIHPVDQEHKLKLPEICRIPLPRGWTSLHKLFILTAHHLELSNNKPTPIMAETKKRSRVFFDISISNKKEGRISFELYDDVVPKTAGKLSPVVI